MREDTNGNATMDPVEDLVIVFDGTTIYKYEDTDGDDIILDTQDPVFTGSIDDINFIWSSSDFLNKMSDGDIEIQRDWDDKTDFSYRYIFTFVDKNGDMVADLGEQMDFISNTPPSAADLTDDSLIYPYLTLFPTFEDEPSIVFDGSTISMDAFRTGHPSEFVDFLANQSKRVIDYIRGIDQPEFVSTGTPAYILPPFRSRQVDYDDDGDIETWRLGDIVYSTPTVVGRPSENYHLLYRDASYAAFANEYRDRRNVVYAGANDGMFHAFNAGFYDETTKSFSTQLTTETAHKLGAELWAYVPFNLLPHLYWLTEPTYPHVYYCDLKPKVFDAKVFPDDDEHPNGWGTLLVGGMRFGGGQIIADMDKTDGNVAVAGDPVMSSAYFILDITDPESEPTVLAEIRFEDLGYTTCYPAVVPMKDKDPATGIIQENEWYLIFGSGPASAAGTADGNSSSEALFGAASDQTAKLYVVDLKELVKNKNLKTLDNLGFFTEAPATVPGDHDYYQSLDADSFVSDPVSVDYNLDYSADAVYFGTVSGDKTTGWGGNLRRLVIDNNLLPTAWEGDSLFFSTDPGQPIVTAPTVGLDDRGNRWIFFGTGRFFVRDDSGHTDTQTYYGIKEPFTDTDGNGFWDPGETPTWGTVLKSNLVDTSNAEVFDDKSITGITDLSGVTVPAWGDLISELDLTSTHGWYLDFSTYKERNLGQATLFGDLLTFTTYVPSSDICSFEGESNLYAVYYKTGTAYFKSVIGSTFTDVNGNEELDPEQGELEMNRKISLGKGLASTPNIHVGKQEGSKAFVQTSTGAIEIIEQINPANVKSGVISWEDME
jgi:type IV pilus assembly protein PilY1